MVRRLPALLAALLLARPAAAAPPTEEQQAVAQVNKAIDRGVAFLKKNHKPATQWESFWLNTLGEMNGGVTALATLALLNCGEKPTDPVVASALDYLRAVPPRRTYVVGLQTMVFAEARQPKDLPRIQANVDWLVKNAYYSGGKIQGWSYPFDRSSRPDASNTQYALLGLYAGKQAGAKIDQAVWKQVQALYLTSQVKEGPTGGYWYYVEGFPRASFTMTVAGVSGLLIAGMGLDESQQGLNDNTGVAARCGQYAENDPVTRGLNWIGRNFSFENAVEAKSVFYNVYGIERVGRLSGQRFIGRYDWYREGCDYLIRTQDPQEGHWSTNRPGGVAIDGVRVMASSFALLFLSKGRTPVLISKLAHGEATLEGRVLTERLEPGGVIGWNRKHSDARNLTDFASRELFGGLPLGWQVYDPRRRDYSKNEDILSEVGVLVQSPILYLNGHKAPRLTGQHEEILKKYVEEGGFVLAEACCGSPEFADGFRELMRKLFPDSPLRKVPPEHPVWRSYFAVPPSEFPQLEYMDRGCRTVVILSPEPLAGFWEEDRFMPKGKEPATKRGQQAFRLGGNVVAYATGMEPPKQRLSVKPIVDVTKEDKSPPRGFVKPAQLRLPDEPHPAPAAMRNLMAYVRDQARVDVVLDKESIRPGDDELFKYKFVYLHGRKRFTLPDEDVENVRANLQSGGLLFADACCGRPEFDASFREFAAKLFPDRKLEPIPADDPLYSEKLTGVPLRSVKRREKSDGPDAGFKDLPPFLEGVKIDGRWAVIYSKYDIGCALEGHKATDCLGHTRESALQLGAAALLYALKR